jgi:hypothetical protein
LDKLPGPAPVPTSQMAGATSANDDAMASPGSEPGPEATDNAREEDFRPLEDGSGGGTFAGWKWS